MLRSNSSVAAVRWCGAGVLLATLAGACILEPEEDGGEPQPTGDQVAEAEQPASAGCGNGTCSGSETCSTCSQDCGTCPTSVSCGDGVCDDWSEGCSVCPADCGCCPGDDFCESGESCADGLVACATCQGTMKSWATWGFPEAYFGRCYTVGSEVCVTTCSLSPACDDSPPYGSPAPGAVANGAPCVSFIPVQD